MVGHTFSDLIRKELGNPWMLRFRLSVVSFESHFLCGRECGTNTP